MNKLILIVGILLVIAGVFTICLTQENKILQIKEKSESVYQGPVPEGYDEQYFRETGITREVKG